MNNKCSVTQRNCSIDIFRLVFAIYVVALHSKTAWLASHPFLSVTVLSFFRFSVPFFLMVSGYYFFKNSSKITLPYMVKYIKSILIVYFAWTCLYSAVKFISWGYQSPAGFLVDWVYSFFILGSYYHLWYFPALIFSLVISAILCKLGLKKLLFCISILIYPLCYLLSEHELLVTLPILPTAVSIVEPLAQGMFYFCCGLLLNLIYDKCVSSKSSRYLPYILPISVMLWFVLIWCDYFFSLGWGLLIIFGIYINVGMTVLVLLLNPLPGCSTAAHKCRYLANFTYYIHPFVRYFLSWINCNWFSFSDFWYFPLTIALTITIGLILYKVNNKHINRIIV